MLCLIYTHSLLGTIPSGIMHIIISGKACVITYTYIYICCTQTDTKMHTNTVPVGAIFGSTYHTKQVAKSISKLISKIVW